jgi:microcin C transport system substrate-binding protein
MSAFGHKRASALSGWLGDRPVRRHAIACATRPVAGAPQHSFTLPHRAAARTLGGVTPRGIFLGLLAALWAAPMPAHAQQALHRFDGAVHRDFGHLPYANPTAPKGGTVRLPRIGAFDSLHPFILRGVPASGLDLTFDTLMTGDDDPHLRHCLLCERVRVAADRRSMEFVLRAEARFHDGAPVLADDVVWTVRTLIAAGHPAYRVHYAGIVDVTAFDARTVRFTFAAPDRDLPLLLGELPVLPRAWWAGRDFARLPGQPIPGSGPYRVLETEHGRGIVYRRDPDYWGRDLPVNRGRYNFDLIRIDYYRDDTAALEAFKAGAVDIRFERSPAVWASGYEGAAVRRAEIPEQRVSGMHGFVMNTRRPFFADRRVRAALIHAFDFEWTNRVLFHGTQRRLRSYFNNGALSALGLPEDAELQVLAPLRGRIPDEVFAQAYEPPRNSGTGAWREQRRIATRLLREAGYRVREGRLTDASGAAVAFEILLDESQLERVALAYAAHLRRLGIAAEVRTVDSAHYRHRIDRFDFDMTLAGLGQSAAPGSEQRGYWTAVEAERHGSLNLAGIRDPAVDALVEQVIAAPDLASLTARTRALDRVLQWGHYVVPLGHTVTDCLAWWDHFGRPAATPLAGVDVTYWWAGPENPVRQAAR